MGKKRTPKPVPEYYEKLPEVKKEGDAKAQLRSFVAREKDRLAKRKLLLGVFHDDFTETGNPLSAWDAFMEARYLKGPIPEWVLEYFDNVGKRLLKAKNTTDDLARCLGFQRGPGPGEWKQYRTLQMKRIACAHILTRTKEDPKVPIEDLCVEAVEKVWERWGVDVEWPTIKRWYYEQ